MIRASTKTGWIAGVMIALALAACVPAFAVDGVVEINQAKVTANGGFPYMITASGSYRLTSNLVSGATPGAISIATTVTCCVTIDLNGFTISGTGGNAGIGAGLAFVGSNPTLQLTVRNGTVTGFGAGIVAGNFARIENVHADSNVLFGIAVGDSSVILDSTANSNIQNGGINCGNNCVISGNTANNNVFGIVCISGAAVGNNCAISGNTTNNNSSTGISAGLNSVISNNTANGNGSGNTSKCATDFCGCAGICADAGSKVTGNTASSNSNEPGLLIGGSALVSGNTANSNGTFGLSFLSPANGNVGYLDNIFSGNSSGSVSSSGGASLGNNPCNGSGC
jgi:hypothetical protein